MFLRSGRLMLFGELGVQKFRHSVERNVARSDAGAVQDEGRRGVDAVTGFRFRRYFVDPRIFGRARDALINLFLAHPRDTSQKYQSVMNPLRARKGLILKTIFYVPFGLILEQQVNEGEVLILRQATGDFFGGTIVSPQWEDAEHVKNLAGIDIFGLETREGLDVEGGANRATGRGIFNEHRLGVAVPQRFIRGQNL